VLISLAPSSPTLVDQDPEWHKSIKIHPVSSRVLLMVVRMMVGLAVGRMVGGSGALLPALWVFPALSGRERSSGCS